MKRVRENENKKGHFKHRQKFDILLTRHFIDMQLYFMNKSFHKYFLTNKNSYKNGLLGI